MNGIKLIILVDCCICHCKDYLINILKFKKTFIYHEGNCTNITILLGTELLYAVAISKKECIDGN